MKILACGWLILAMGLAGPAVAQDISHGKALFESSCQRCHRAGPASLKTPPAELTATLTSNPIRSHRFTLSDAEVQAVVVYLGSIAAPR